MWPIRSHVKVRGWTMMVWTINIVYISTVNVYSEPVMWRGGTVEVGTAVCFVCLCVSIVCGTPLKTKCSIVVLKKVNWKRCVYVHERLQRDCRDATRVSLQGPSPFIQSVSHCDNDSSTTPIISGAFLWQVFSDVFKPATSLLLLHFAPPVASY